ncbi:hypothetical protein Sango_2485900 [Sesamum angolense]|uniref:Reverse transcriptase/retrotransposon-derived protein RNase H-like domain-containing protein n=1 Tax=Sesamum angolense TaxID=2727404 RepID=A0AAE1W3M4_9LAMI|nr:hypothetical protein Sango_2485900 [Sesamum angolense]
MSGLDPKVAVHHLSVKKGARLIKQGQRRFPPKLIPSIEGEVNKLIELLNARTSKHPRAQEFARKASISPEIYFKSSRSLSTIQSSNERDVLLQWDETHDKAFKSIKSYLMKPPVLVAPVPGRPLIPHVAAQERCVGILLAQKNDEGKENDLYDLSRAMTPNELKYSPIEKSCLALIFSIQKLKHYFQSHSIHLVSKANPFQYVMAKLVLLDRLARWYLQLQQFEITYVPQKAVKGQVLADFLVDHPMPAE